MDSEIYARTEALLGPDAMDTLHSARMAVFGVGGVGSACAEALARCGVGRIDLFDPDTVSFSNINRQLIALHSTVGRYKADVMKERIREIDPEIDCRAYKVFYEEANCNEYPFGGYDYIADCIDTVSSKLLIIKQARLNGVKVISALGTGNKLHPELLRCADIKKTNVCPLARVMRRLCRENGITELKVIYSEEEPRKVCVGEENGRHPPASISFVPPAAGMLMAGEIIREILNIQ